MFFARIDYKQKNRPDLWAGVQPWTSQSLWAEGSPSGRSENHDDGDDNGGGGGYDYGGGGSPSGRSENHDDDNAGSLS